jgi:hypothetical protein
MDNVWCRAQEFEGSRDSARAADERTIWIIDRIPYIPFVLNLLYVESVISVV